MQNKTSSRSGFFRLRVLVALSLCSMAAMLAIFSLAAPAPASGTLSTSNPSITYTEPPGMQTVNDTHVALGKPNCTAPTSCSTFNLTLDPTLGTAVSGYDPTQYQINITWSWPVATVDYDVFVEDSASAVLASNRSTSDPSGIIIPATTAAGVYKLIVVLATGAPVGFTGVIKLEPKPPVIGLCNPNVTNCTPPRYESYGAGPGQADDAGEPSLGVDWNPNLAALKHDKVNTGGVAFFTSGRHEWRVNFDDCSSPAINLWEDVSTVFDQNTALVDPIGFVDHYTSVELGRSYPPPHTPGRIFAMQLLGGQGNSLSGYSDDDGQNYLPGGNGGPGQGPDHETLGGGPYMGTPPANAMYPATGTKNAIYYCSQNIVAEAQCSRSDNGGQTFGAAVPIFTPTQCTGGIHGHLKVAPDGTVYVPNSSCGTSGPSAGTNGVAVSIDNGLTWIQNNVPGSTGNQDPSVGIGQNTVGKPAGNLNGTNTIYLGWVSGDGHAHVAHSGDRGATFTGDTDVGAPFGVTHAVFPVVVAGDDNRAAFAFLGTGDGIATTGVCNPYGATLNCKNLWHLYIATTYDGGANWITIDGTPNDPVQTGTVCLEGTTCAGGRNLLDFNDFGIDAEGRGLVGYADGCVNCPNTFVQQSSSEHGTVTRQSGGRRLFSFFDPVEPAVPAAPQMIKAIGKTNGALITWREPDNGGSPITGYKVYRGATSGGETFLAAVSGATNTKYLDPSPPAGNVFYYVTAVNLQGESAHCRDVMLVPLPPCVEPTGPFFDDLEPTAEPGWVVDTAQNNNAPASLPWQVATDPMAHSASHSFTSDSTSPDIKDDRLIAPPQNISPTTHLIFWHRFQFEDTFDGGVLEVSSDNGDTWVDVLAGGGSFISGGYNGTIDTRFGSPIAGRPAWTGGDASSPMTKVEVNLGAFTGINVKVRFRLACDELGGTPGVGWFVDDVQFTNPLSCPNLLPVADLRANPTSGPAPLTVHFSGTNSFDPDFSDTIVNYAFKFGDGSSDVSGGSPEVDHTYTTAGTYTASLVVTDSRGGVSQNTAEQVITVQSSASPTPTATPTATATATASPTATATATASPTPTATATASPSATATATASPTATATATASPSATATATATPTATASATPTATPSATPTATPANVQLVNIAGRVFAQTGDKVGIAGFIISGSGTKRIMARAIGPSLNVNGKLQDPYLEIHDSSGSPPLTNDNWRSTQEAEIQQTGLAPTNDKESAVVKRLPPGNYTAIIRGADNSPGIGVVELYDLSTSDPGELGNLSVRASAETGDNVLFDGLILRGGTPKRVLFRALGPSVKVNGNTVPGALADPTLELHDGNGALMATNDNWPDAPNAAEIQATGLAPPDNHESAILMPLSAGNYTTIVRGVGNTTGIGLAEAYKLNN